MQACHLIVLKHSSKLSPLLKVDFLGKMLKSKHFGVKNSRLWELIKISQNTPHYCGLQDTSDLQKND